MELIMEKWIDPYVDTSKWEFYNLSCKTRDDTEDQCLHDAVAGVPPELFEVLACK